jgi:hypothetical protein
MAWKVISPRPLNKEAMRKALYENLEKISEDVLQDFSATTDTWNRNVKFDRLVREDTQSIVQFEVSTADEIYKLVSKGSPAHYIEPVEAKALKYQSTYRSKTEPRMIGSRGGGKSGSDVFARSVWHPGFNAREFDKAVADKWREMFASRLAAAMKDVAKASGHSIR